MAISSVASQWSDIADATNNGIQTIAIVGAGILGYARFLRGRVLHSNLDLSLAAQLVEAPFGPAARVTASVRNSGSFKMTFPMDCWVRVTMQCADVVLWEDAMTDGEVQWDAAETRHFELLIDQGVQETREILEPGESFVRTLATPVPTGTWVAYRFILSVKSKAKYILRTDKSGTWTTSTIVVSEMPRTQPTDEPAGRYVCPVGEHVWALGSASDIPICTVHQSPMVETARKPNEERIGRIEEARRARILAESQARDGESDLEIE